MSANAKSIRNLTISACCLALCMLLPFLTGQIPQIGQALSPMHLPVLLTGFIAGPVYGAVVGFIAPLMRFLLFGMPPIMPTGVAMAFELATYGLLTGILYAKLSKSTANLFISLVCAMVAGRVVWGIVRVILSGVAGSSFTWAMFLTGAVTSALPGIAVQLVLVPVIVKAVEKSRESRSA